MSLLPLGIGVHSLLYHSNALSQNIQKTILSKQHSTLTTTNAPINLQQSLDFYTCQMLGESVVNLLSQECNTTTLSKRWNNRLTRCNESLAYSKNYELCIQDEQGTMIHPSSLPIIQVGLNDNSNHSSPLGFFSLSIYQIDLYDNQGSFQLSVRIQHDQAEFLSNASPLLHHRLLSTITNHDTCIMDDQFRLIRAAPLSISQAYWTSATNFIARSPRGLILGDTRLELLESHCKDLHTQCISNITSNDMFATCTITSTTPIIHYYDLRWLTKPIVSTSPFHFHDTGRPISVFNMQIDNGNCRMVTSAGLFDHGIANSQFNTWACGSWLGADILGITDQEIYTRQHGVCNLSENLEIPMELTPRKLSTIQLCNGYEKIFAPNTMLVEESSDSITSGHHPPYTPSAQSLDSLWNQL